MTKTQLVAKAKKIAVKFNLAEDGSQRKADMLRRYQEVVAMLGYDPMI